MATFYVLDGAMKLGEAEYATTASAQRAGIWGRISTWALVALLLYFAVDGVSPFQNGAVSMRVVATQSEGGVLWERLNNVLIVAACSILAVGELRSIGWLSRKMALVTAFPILAFVLLPVSQQITRSISSGAVLAGSILIVYCMVSKYTFDEILEIFLVLGTLAMAASVFLAVALPQYGLDLMGERSTPWKGIFSAKNHLGNMALFFLTAAVTYRGRTSFLRSVRVVDIALCLIAIAFSHAATAYALTVLYLLYFAIMHILRRFARRDFLAIGATLSAVFIAAAVWILTRPEFLFKILNKDATLTGRTGIWETLFVSIGQRPLFGYGYHAFWLGYEGESARVLITLGWVLNQAQSGFVDVMLEMGAVGLTLTILVFICAFRDAAACLLKSRDRSQLRAVEWYFAIVILTLVYNMVESFLFEPRHLGSVMFLIACVGLRVEALRLRLSLRAQSVGQDRQSGSEYYSQEPAVDRECSG